MSFHESVSALPPAAQLRVAVKAADTVLLRKVLAAHPEILNLADGTGRTPLFLAAEWQQFPVVVALVELGADVSIENLAGYTARDIALWCGEYRMGAYTEVCRKIVACLETPTLRVQPLAPANHPPSLPSSNEPSESNPISGDGY